MTSPQKPDLVLHHARKGRMHVIRTDEDRFENWSYAEPHTLKEWAIFGWHVA